MAGCPGRAAKAAAIRWLLCVPSWRMTQVKTERLHDYSSMGDRALDLSEVPPAARFEMGRDGYLYLYEVLSRIELPAEKEGQRGNSSIPRALKGRFYAGDLSLQGREEIFTFTDKRNGPVLLHRSSGGNIVHILFYCISWNLQGGSM